MRLSQLQRALKRPLSSLSQTKSWIQASNSRASSSDARDAFSSGRNEDAFFRYMDLDQGSGIQAEYVWIGGSGLDMRCKSQVLKNPVSSVNDLPDWQFDGSSTGQASGTATSEVHLRPVKFVPDPFRGAPNILVLCECETAQEKEKKPVATNNRAFARSVFEQEEVIRAKPWFGVEQEYTLFERDGVTPLGWPLAGFPAPQGPYYCGIGTRNAFGRPLVEAHFRACMYSGLEIGGINAEVMPGQWEYQIGPVEGIDCADQMWLSRYILERVAEDFGAVVSFAPKPVQEGDWNGAGCHTNYSTESTRGDNGMEHIVNAIKKLEGAHDEHMAAYGEDNRLRMTGHCETANYNEFSYGVGHRGVSVRIPNPVAHAGKGYFEDRRPAANMDPYLVTTLIAKTTLLTQAEKMAK